MHRAHGGIGARLREGTLLAPGQRGQRGEAAIAAAGAGNAGADNADAQRDHPLPRLAARRARGGGAAAASAAVADIFMGMFAENGPLAGAHSCISLFALRAV